MPRTSSASTASRTAWTELYGIGDDFGAVLLLTAGLVVPAAGLHTAFDVCGASLLEVLLHRISLATEDDDVVEIALFLLLAVAILEDAIGRDREIAHVHARRQGAEFGVAREIAEEDRLIDVHIKSLALLGDVQKCLVEVDLGNRGACLFSASW